MGKYIHFPKYTSEYILKGSLISVIMKMMPLLCVYMFKILKIFLEGKRIGSLEMAVVYHIPVFSISDKLYLLV